MCVEMFQDNDPKKSGIEEEFYVRRDGKWVQITEEEFLDLLFPKESGN